MEGWLQTAVVALIGTAAAAYLLRRAWRRLRPPPATPGPRPRCGGGCGGCGGCPPHRP